MATPPQQFGAPDQMQQMQALMSMMAAGGMGGGGLPPAMPQAYPGAGLHGLGGMDPMAAAAAAQGFPAVDPNMAQAYASVLQSYLQQGLAAQVPGAAPINPYAMPPVANPYAPQQALAEPTVSVAVEGMKFQYQLTEDDLHKVFKRYGSVKRVNVDDACSSATVTFHSVQDAQAAINDLDGKVLNGLEGTLRISWVSQGAAAAAPAPPFPGMGCGFPGLPPLGGGFAQGAGAWNAPAGQVIPPSSSGLGGMGASGGEARPPHVKGARKFTCRFLIGIDNDKDFQVARRLIGSKGANMKRIVRQTEAKLRLRGQGSGYFEGAGQKESSEPLQLCVSCTSQDGYKMAVRQVEELLTRIYEDYRQFCRETNLPEPEDLRINFSENQLVYTGRGASGGDGGMDGGAGDSPKRRGNQRGGAGKAAGRGLPGSSGEGDRGEPGPNAPPVEDIQQKISDRNEARRACNYAEADRIREELHSRGVALMDEPGGRGKGSEVTTWRYWRD